MRLPEPFTWFIDRSLGRGPVASALRAAVERGEDVVLHDDLFAQDTPDERWLVAVAARRWVILTKDTAIRRTPFELGALLGVGAAAFLLSRADLSGERAGAAFVAALPRMRRALRRFEPAIVASVDSTGAVTVTHARGARLAHAKRLK